MKVVIVKVSCVIGGKIEGTSRYSGKTVITILYFVVY